MSTEERKVPELRFKGFSDDWEQRKLGDISDIQTGGTPKTKIKEYWNPKEIPWMSSGEINKKRIKKTDKKISIFGHENSSARWIKKNSVLVALAGQGKTRGLVAVNEINLTTNQSIAAIIPTESLYFEFLFHNLEKRYEELRSISSGDGTRGGLNKQLVSNLLIKLPAYDEQVKIGEILKKVNILINLHQRKLNIFKNIKHTYLLKLFADNFCSIPSLKFGEYSTSWKKYKMKDVLTVSKERNYDNKWNRNKVLSVSREVGTVNQIEYQGRSFAGSDISKYKVVRVGQMVYTKSPLKGAPYGIFQKVSTNGIVSPLYAVFNSTKGTLAEFISLQLNDDNIATHYLAPLVTKGAKNTINVTDETVLEGHIFVPELSEQRRIVELIKMVDNNISLYRSKIIHIEKLKKEYLNKMFI